MYTTGGRTNVEPCSDETEAKASPFLVTREITTSFYIRPSLGKDQRVKGYTGEVEDIWSYR